ncbi:MAG: hypothetical protein ABI672_09345 [Vicinamibacteria bacterium]
MKSEKGTEAITNFRAKAGSPASGPVSVVLSCLTDAAARPSSTPVEASPKPRVEPQTPPPAPAATGAAKGFSVGTFDIGPTVGFGGTGVGGSVSIGGRVEKAVKGLDSGVLSIGGFVQRWSYDPCGGVLANCGASTTFFGATANYHFTIHDHPRWDPFVGLGLGYARAGFDGGAVFGRFTVSSGVAFVGNAGVRYFLSDNMAAYADLGAGAATVNLGLMFKLK